MKDYYREKVKFKYSSHPNVDPDDIQRASDIIRILDTDLHGMIFKLNDNYIIAEQLNPKYRRRDIKICGIDFVNLEPRIFYDLEPEEFRPFDKVGQMEIANYANFGGGARPRPYYRFDNHHIHAIVSQRDKYFAEVAIEVHDYLVNREER